MLNAELKCSEDALTFLYRKQGGSPSRTCTAERVGKREPVDQDFDRSFGFGTTDSLQIVFKTFGGQSLPFRVHRTLRRSSTPHFFPAKHLDWEWRFTRKFISLF